MAETGGHTKTTGNATDWVPKQIQLNGINRWIAWGLKAAVAAGLMVFLIKVIDPEEISYALSNAEAGFLIAALLLAPINLLLQALRWRLFVNTEVRQIPFSRCFASLLGGFVMGLITPGRVGEIGRVFLLRVPSRLRLAGLHVLDKMYMFGAVALTGPLLLFMFPGFRDELPSSLRLGIGLFVGILPLLYIWMALDPRPLKSLLLGIQLVFPRKPKALEMLRAFEGLQPAHSLRAFVLTSLQLIVIFTQFFLISNAFQAVKWHIAAHTYGAVLFIKTVLPVSLGSLGVGEWATVSLYERYGIANSTAFSSSLLLFGINVLLPAIAGLWVLMQARTLPAKGISGKDRSVAA